MSSMISMSSYYGKQRRKSAEPRLQVSSSEKDLCIPALNISPPPTRQCPLVLRYANRRVKSATATRKEHENSEVFPEVEKGKPDPDWLKSKYSLEYCAKKLTSPTRARPLSPTRMNNPHPNKEFITWKFPGRIHQHKRAIPPPPQVWRYIHESFYEDCIDTSNTGDMKTGVPITNVAKIAFPGNQAAETEMSSLMSGVAGKKVQLNSRHESDGKNKREEQKSRVKLMYPPNPEAVLMHHTIKSQYVPVLQEWLKEASTKEREVVMEMLQEGHDEFTEEWRLSKAVTEVLQPESAECVQNWLKGTTPSERKLVLNVLENLKISTRERDTCGDTYPAYYSRLLHRRDKHRRYTCPHPSLHVGSGRFSSNKSCSHICAKHAHVGPSSTFVMPKPEMGLVVKKIPKPERQYDEKPELWHNRIMRKGHLPTYPRAGGMFHRPHRDMGQHFTIHPEWPTA